jgi:hypothetical protein
MNVAHYCCSAAIVDIGSATFKYDMKRLAEILGFPKAWYRRTIVRRLFLGDMMVRQGSTGAGISSAGRPPSEPRSPRGDLDAADDSHARKIRYAFCLRSLANYYLLLKICSFRECA